MLLVRRRQRLFWPRIQPVFRRQFQETWLAIFSSFDWHAVLTDILSAPRTKRYENPVMLVAFAHILTNE